METIISILKFCADIALWDMLTCIAAIIGASALYMFCRRRHSGFSLYVSYRIGTGHSLYPNVIYFTARNVADTPIVICRPNFKPSKHLGIDDTAHGNLDTLDYELKFRHIAPDYKIIKGNSFTTILLRHRESAMAYLPIGRCYDDASFHSLIGKKPLGWITFDIVTVGDGRPKIIRMKQKVRRIVREAHDLELGFDPADALKIKN